MKVNQRFKKYITYLLIVLGASTTYAIANTFGVVYSVYFEMVKQMEVGGYPKDAVSLVAKLRFLETNRALLGNKNLIRLSEIASNITLREASSHLSETDAAILKAWHLVLPYEIAATENPTLKEEDYISLIKELSESKPNSLFGQVIFQPHAIYMVSKEYAKSLLVKSAPEGASNIAFSPTILHRYANVSQQFQCDQKRRELRTHLGFKYLEEFYFENGFALWDLFLSQANTHEGISSLCSEMKYFETLENDFKRCFSQKNYDLDVVFKEHTKIDLFFNKSKSITQFIKECRNGGPSSIQ